MLNPQTPSMYKILNAEGPMVKVGLLAASLGAVREAWNAFKQEDIDTHYEAISKQWNAFPAKYSKATPLKIASKYTKFLDDIKKTMLRDDAVAVRDVSWLHKFSEKISGSIEESKLRDQNVEALLHVQGAADAVFAAKLEKAGISTFNEAINLRVRNDLPEIIELINKMSDAFLINAIGESVTDENENVYRERSAHLKNKLGVIRSTLEKGVLLGNKSPSDAKPELQHIIDGMARMDPNALPVVVAIENEAPLPTKLSDPGIYSIMDTYQKNENGLLYHQWNSSFERGAASLDPAKILVQLEQFYQTLKNRIRTFERGPDASTLFLVEKLYDRIESTRTMPSTDKDTAYALAKLSQSTSNTVMEHASYASFKVIENLNQFSGVYSTPDGNLKLSRLVETAAKIQTMALRFSPEFQYNYGVKKIDTLYEKVKEPLVAPFFFEPSERFERWQQAIEQVSITGQAIKTMYDYQDTRAKRISENERNPTIAPSRLRSEWDKHAPKSNDMHPETIATKYGIFEEFFSVFSKQHPPSIDALELMSSMHKHIGQTLHEEMPGLNTKRKLSELVEKTELYLKSNAHSIANSQAAQLGVSELNSYSDIAHEASLIRSAAQAHIIATTFAPDVGMDSIRKQRIEEQFSKIQTLIAIGSTLDDKPMPLLDNADNGDSFKIILAQTESQIRLLSRDTTTPLTPSTLTI